jgi:hypothetical protein
VNEARGFGPNPPAPPRSLGDGKERAYTLGIGANYHYSGTITVIARSEAEAVSIGLESISNTSLSMEDRIEGTEYAEVMSVNELRKQT